MTIHPLRFITFEGGEGGGKSTQVRLLQERITALGYEVVVTREPGGSPRGEEIREFILSGRGKPYGPLAEAVLFSAARIDHLRETIVPALERGAFVLCDRFADSTRAYQGVLGDIDVEAINSLERVAVGQNKPSLTLIMDISPEAGLERANVRREQLGGAVDRFEGEGFEFHRKLRQAFLDIAKANPERCRVINAERSREAIAEDIWATVTKHFTLSGDA
ncbi:dTMP kinase [Microvirga sp. W0021]|uniref:Thymidylate kinase n=1 Tax=Hohaiivirga grylli TaxID=3133970 RepID=A0ABV0BIS5_9HYPH